MFDMKIESPDYKNKRTG